MKKILIGMLAVGVIIGFAFTVFSFTADAPQKTEIKTGDVQVQVKNGTLNAFAIDYNYYKQGTQYIIVYNVKDRGDPELLKELGLTMDQAKLVTPGKHTITSTSPYTADDVRADFRAVILKDLASTIKK